ncbi:uncharacterized protein [Rutidosis leptorrhynchoides]|uniref:uncharacterized protein n=1 Tax=Rutidosis leptorrhynchoides TaxID=125765 RepID=UPI003A99E3D5
MAMKFDIQFCGHSSDSTEYDVIVDDDCFEMLVTRHPYKIERWITEIENWNNRRLHLKKNHKIPEDLKEFLKNPNYTFVGVGIENDKQKLYIDHGLEVGKCRDLRQWAANELRDESIGNFGLVKLAKLIIGKDVGDVDRMKKVKMSDWGSVCLSNEHVMFACIDAYLSFAIGRALQSWYD